MLKKLLPKTLFRLPLFVGLFAVVGTASVSYLYTSRPAYTGLAAGNVIKVSSSGFSTSSALRWALILSKARTNTLSQTKVVVRQTKNPIVIHDSDVALAVPSDATGLYADPESSPVLASQAWMANHGSDAGLQKINATPTAKWFGDWSKDVQAETNAYVSAAQTVGKIPVLVAYNIPNRDCGGQSSGGSASASTYATWINAFASGISKRSAIVILEPDSVAAHCFDDNRASILSNAITTLVNNSSASVYLDSGNGNWLSVSTMASRLKKSNIAHATGFSLNVSNFITTSSNIDFGNSLSPLIGGKHFIIDTSRNGRGPTADFQWCNPPDRALGQQPTLQTGNILVDAFLWVKTPGESDGNCGSNVGNTSPPAAGVWWPEYALMLARN